jgi:hypothetical protein
MKNFDGQYLIIDFAVGQEEFDIDKGSLMLKQETI